MGSDPFELPLFPLNTVLFPGMPLPLHIFEERYKRMVRRCLARKQPFGVALIRQGVEAYGLLAEPHEVGCTARVVEMQPLDDGRLNIITLGENRIRILTTRVENGYLVGQVEMFPLVETNPSHMNSSARRLLPWVRKYMQILSEASESDLDPQNLPDDPLVLAYLAAVLLQISPEQKQPLLASPSAVDLLDLMESIYRREVPLLQALIDQDRRQDPSPFSAN